MSDAMGPCDDGCACKHCGAEYHHADIEASVAAAETTGRQKERAQLLVEMELFIQRWETGEHVGMSHRFDGPLKPRGNHDSMLAARIKELEQDGGRWETSEAGEATCEYDKDGGCGSLRTPHPVTEVFVTPQGLIFKYANGAVHCAEDGAKIGGCEKCGDLDVYSVYGDGQARCAQHLKE